MPLTPAEKSKRYRERLKQTDPEKYRQLLEGCAKRALKSYRAKYPKLKQETNEEFRLPLTAAEKSKRYRERLKQTNPEKYRQLLKGCAKRALKSYDRAKYAKLNEEPKGEFRVRCRENNKNLTLSDKKRKSHKNISLSSDSVDNPTQTSQINVNNTNLNKYFDNMQKCIQRTLRNENAKLHRTVLSLKKDHNEVLEKLLNQQQQLKQMDEKLRILTKDLRQEPRRTSSVETVLELVPNIQVKLERADESDPLSEELKNL